MYLHGEDVRGRRHPGAALGKADGAMTPLVNVSITVPGAPWRVLTIDAVFADGSHTNEWARLEYIRAAARCLALRADHWPWIRSLTLTVGHDRMWFEVRATLRGRDDGLPFEPNFVDDVAHADMDRDRVLEWLRSRLGWILLHELDESLLVHGGHQWDPHRPWINDACPRCGRPSAEIDPQRGQQLPP
jgi:hypothetical protein